jgi:hypothetical protein
VDGHTAFWTAQHGYLIWQYADNGWAALASPRNAATSTVVKVASAVSYGVAGAPVKYPAQLVNLPAGWALGFVFFKEDAGVLRASQYSLTGPGVSVPAPNFTTDPATAKGSCYFYPGGESTHQTINGYPVTVNLLPASNGNAPLQQVCAANADGLFVFVSTYGKDPSPNAIAIFSRHMRLLGTNPAGWTTEPLG